MHFNGFIKQTAKLSGKEKAAILFSELGMASNPQWLSMFTDSELRKIRLAMKNLGSDYNVHAENAVLEETARMGMIKGYVDPAYIDFAQKKAESDYQKDLVAQRTPNLNPQDIARVLSMMLKEDR